MKFSSNLVDGRVDFLIRHCVNSERQGDDCDNSESSHGLFVFEERKSFKKTFFLFYYYDIGFFRF